jgi:hypothetical protein
MEGWEFLVLAIDPKYGMGRLHIIARMSFLVQGFRGATDVRGETE